MASTWSTWSYTEGTQSTASTLAISGLHGWYSVYDVEVLAGTKSTVVLMRTEGLRIKKLFGTKSTAMVHWPLDIAYSYKGYGRQRDAYEAYDRIHTWPKYCWLWSGIELRSKDHFFDGIEC